MSELDLKNPKLLDLIDPEKMNSRLTKKQIIELVARNPARFLPELKRVVLPPSRLFFPQLHEPKSIIDKKTGKPGAPKYNAMVVPPPGANLEAVMEGWYAACEEFWPKNPRGVGFDVPVKEQAAKINIEDGGKTMEKSLKGCIIGGYYLSPNANPDYAPELFVYRSGQPEVFRRDDPAKVQQEFYGGCWAVVTISFFKGSHELNKGVFASLGSVTKICDDNKFTGGGSENVGKAFEGFQLDAGLDLASNFSGAGGDATDAGEDPLAQFYN